VAVIRTQLQYIVSTGVLLKLVQARTPDIVSLALKGFQPAWDAGGSADSANATAADGGGAQPAWRRPGSGGDSLLRNVPADGPRRLRRTTQAPRRHTAQVRSASARRARRAAPAAALL